MILSTHPIQYQVPIWQALARDGSVPFEVWYLSEHGVAPSADREFGKTFAWDIDLLSGYPHRFLDGAKRSEPGHFWGCRLHENLSARLKRAGATALWMQGWQVAAYWQAARQAKAAGVPVWLRGESNDLAATPWWKRPLKRLALGYLFSRVNRFLSIGSANARLYRRFDIPDRRLSPAPYAVDNERFAKQADALRPQRQALRRQWGIGEDAFCVLFCGKFIAKKRPMDLVRAAASLGGQGANVHLLFAGAGELEPALRDACNDVRASFAGFLNQTEISRAYVAADCLVLPSDATETWGLVVNEAMASGLPCIVSDACGCAEDLVAPVDPRFVFRCTDTAALANALTVMHAKPQSPDVWRRAVSANDFQHTVATVVALAGKATP
ncbi:MAG: glycosyltransferase family 4 protein [Pseudolabrys sp.]|nr:glycosyltransferase family 4 protein [Pseudolabrys sp.]